MEWCWPTFARHNLKYETGLLPLEEFQMTLEIDKDSLAFVSLKVSFPGAYYYFYF